MTKRETSADIQAAALQWVARMDADPLDRDVQKALEDWLAGDSRRVGAFARAEAMFGEARRAKALGPDFDPDRFAPPAIAPDVEAPPAPVLLSRRRMIMGGSIATISAIAAVGGISWQAAAETIVTRRGEIRTMPLEDGSSITLNTSSRARVRFGDTERRIDLLDGEALFNVARDPHRPFLVFIDNTAVRATGTSFSVRRTHPDVIDLVVRQGSVELSNRSEPRPNPTIVVANTFVEARRDTTVRVTALSPGQVDRRLAWRDGLLAFEDETLREAAEEFARYSERRIDFADASIGEERVTGLYAASNPDGFARSAALSLGLTARPGPAGVLLLR